MQEYQFRGIEKSEWNNLFSFIQAKRLRIENVDEAKQGPAGPSRAAALLEDLGDDDEIDPGGPLSDQQRIPQCKHNPRRRTVLSQNMQGTDWVGQGMPWQQP